jgi:5-oxoprolinase (ATP-hydrolysing)
VDPRNYADAPTEGIRRLLEGAGQVTPPGTPINTSAIECIRMGTTVATNALLEKEGARIAFITTRGLSDLQHIGNQTRPRIFDLEINRPELLYKVRRSRVPAHVPVPVPIPFPFPSKHAQM